jgi:hypothetical protein
MGGCSSQRVLHDFKIEPAPPRPGNRRPAMAPNGTFFTFLRIAACREDRQEKVGDIVAK